MKNRNYKKINRRFVSFFCLFALIAANLSFVVGQTNRGAGNVSVKTPSGKFKDVKLYDGSFALVIGNSNYQFWDNLPGVRSDIEAVKNSLTANGFTVETAADLNSRDLSDRIDQFVGDYGYSKNNRLLIYYAGHGHTQKTIDDADERELGFIIPTDAPLPDKDLTGFFRKAVSLEKIRTFAREIQAKHAIFLFDSCFSGKLVSRSNIAVPPIVEESVTYPVRQFITAGAANQPVPDESIFRRAFVRALEGDADANRDGYVLGTELAAFLRDKVSNSSRRTQTPQYGKIDDIALDRGDFVFTVTGKNADVSAESDKPKIDDAPTIVRSRADIEREAWSYIRSSTDPQDFRDFLKEFPDGANASNAKIKLEQTVWDAVKTSSDKAKIQNYLNEFPTGANSFLAKTRIRQIEAAANTTTPTNTTNNNSGEIKAGTIRKNGIGMELAYIPAGEFMMGSPASEEYGKSNERPQRKITIREGFWMGKYEVTQTQYESVMGTNPSRFKNCPQCPVEQVSWIDAKKFVQNLNAKNDGFTYSLPSEAEWEYAARAGKTTAFTFGDSLDSSQANFNGNSFDGTVKGVDLQKTVSVGTYKPNEWGLYDMHGNVYEWVEDFYTSTYEDLPSDGTALMKMKSEYARVMRGSSWNNHAVSLRSAFRNRNDGSYFGSNIGFRIAARSK